jgi:hypothetical protein
MKGRVTRFLGVIALLGAGEVVADSVLLSPLKDNTLFEDSGGSLSNGEGDSVFVGRSGVKGEFLKKRGVIAFDVAGEVPAGSTITGVTLTLYLVQASPLANDDDLTLHWVLADWGEGGSFSPGGAGAPAERDDATWLHTFFPDQFWASAGGDFNPTPSATLTVGVLPGPYTWGPAKQMTADVQGWLDDPGSNYGWLILGNEIDLFSARRFGSREADVSIQPVLTVDFKTSGCVWDCAAEADGQVATADLLALLEQWGAPGSCDFDGNNVVSTSDLLKMLAEWGPCD